MQETAYSRFTMHRCLGAWVLCLLPSQPISPRLATFLELRDGCVAMQVPYVFEHLNIVISALINSIQVIELKL